MGYLFWIMLASVLLRDIVPAGDDMLCDLTLWACILIGSMWQVWDIVGKFIKLPL